MAARDDNLQREAISDESSCATTRRRALRPRAAHAADRVDGGVRHHRSPAGRCRATGARPGRDTGAGGSAASSVRPRPARDHALHAMARACRDGQLRHVAVEQSARERAHCHASAELARARRIDGARLGAGRAFHRHCIGDVSRLAAGSHAQRAHAFDRRGAGVSRRDHRGADLRGGSCAGCPRCRISRMCHPSAGSCAPMRCP